MEESNRIYYRDVRARPFRGHGRPYCKDGIQLFCEKYSLDFNALQNEGIPIETLEALHDSMADKVVEYVKNGRK